jgi:hypothetical protein
MHPGRWTAYSRESTSPRFTDIFGKTVGRHGKRDTFPNLIHDEATMHPLDWAAFLGNTAAMEIRRACPIFGYFWNNYAAFVFVGPHQRIRRRVRRFVLA